MALTLKKTALKTLVSPILAATLLMGSSFNALAQGSHFHDNSDSPNGLAMFTDLVVLRPLGFAATVVGSAAWLVGLPFTLPMQCATEAGQGLVVEPAAFTFARCLGCTRSGPHRNAAEEENTSDEPFRN
ncbi:MAG: hypothetical protein IT470_06370 [Pseudomonadales bacterium]|nr:hypothetical protein [Pseudomonadales bacterium]